MLSNSLLPIYVSLHTISFTIWTGMGILLPLVFLPIIRKMDEAQQVKMMSEITRKFLPWFIAAGIVVGLTGWAQTLILFDSFGHQPYIYIKHVDILLLAIVSTVLWFWWGFFMPKGKPGMLLKWLPILAWLQFVFSVGALVLCALMITI